jgi:NAD(P)-dependent dehydrogenase (short-subunit alcohol dehydrogenase family)
MDVVVIVGAGGGVGQLLVSLLVEQGKRVLAVGRRAESLKVFEGVGAVEPYVADATDFAQVDQAFAHASQLGPLRGAVNLAGSILIKPAHLTSAQEWQDTLAQNATTAFATVRAAGRTMREGGAVVLVSSAAAHVGLGNHEAIAAAKGAVSSLVASAAATYASRGLRFNAVAPGLMETPMAARITGSAKALEASIAMHPLGRIGRAADAAQAIAFLLDPKNDWITGQVLGVDGGLARLRKG